MARCQCEKKCDCYLLDDGYVSYALANSTTTTVRGIGSENRPYYVQNIHHPKFIAPAAKVRAFNTPASTLQFISWSVVDYNTDGIFNINQPDVFTIIHAGQYMFGATVQWSGPPDLYTNFGIYYGRSGSFFGSTPATASPAAVRNLQYTGNQPSFGSTMSRIAPYTASLGFNYNFAVGDFLKVGVFGANPSNPGASLMTFWIVYD